MLEQEKQFIQNNPSVRLITWSQDMVNSIVAVWEISRKSKEKLLVEFGTEVITPEVIKERRLNDPHYNKVAEETFHGAIHSAIPIGKTVSMTVEFGDTSTVFRSHLVRHSGITGHWAKSNRSGDLSKFKYPVPKLILGNPEALELYLIAMSNTRESYRKLIALGMLEEDVREILPVGHTQTISSAIPLHSLAHIVNVRSSWFASEFWVEIIGQLMNEIKTRVPEGELIARSLAPNIPTTYHPNELEALTRFPKDLSDPQGPRIDDNPIDPIMYQLLVDRGMPMRPYHEYILPKALNKARMMRDALSKVWTGQAKEILDRVTEGL